ncbi:hypothetical protein D3C73_1620670 [compost metagenome]
MPRVDSRVEESISALTARWLDAGVFTRFHLYCSTWFRVRKAWSLSSETVI